MITGTIIKSGTLKLVITGSDEIDMAVLKQLNGATCTLVTDNLRLVDKNISGGLLIESNEKKEDDRRTETIGEVVPDTEQSV